MAYVFMLLLGGTIWLLINGIGELKLALENPDPQVMTIERFNQSPNESGWFRVTDGAIDLRQAMYTEGGSGGIDEVYVPVINQTDTASTSLLLKTDDPEILKALNTLRIDAEKLTTEEETFTYLMEHQDELVRSMPVEGMTEYGTDDMDDEVRGEVQGMSYLSDNFVVLTHHDHPTLLSGILKTAGGVILPLLLILGIRKSREEKEGASEEQGETIPDDAAPHAGGSDHRIP